MAAVSDLVFVFGRNSGRNLAGTLAGTQAGTLIGTLAEFVLKQELIEPEFILILGQKFGHVKCKMSSSDPVRDMNMNKDCNVGLNVVSRSPTDPDLDLDIDSEPPLKFGLDKILILVLLSKLGGGSMTQSSQLVLEGSSRVVA